MPIGSPPDVPPPPRKPAPAKTRRCLGPIDRATLEQLRETKQISENDYRVINFAMLEFEATAAKKKTGL